MILSKKRLIEEQKRTGFRQEMIEKVFWLIQILNNITDIPRIFLVEFIIMGIV